MRDPRELTRSWPTLGAWGAGLLQLALGAGALTGDGDVATRLAGTVLVAGGAAALAWGAATLARGRIVVPRAGIVGVLAGFGGMTLALAADPAHSSVLAMTVTALLLLTVGAMCGVASRRDVRHDSTGSAGGTRPTGVVGILTGSIAVALIVVPALAATEAGQLAPDHSDHTVVVEHGHGH